LENSLVAECSGCFKSSAMGHSFGIALKKDEKDINHIQASIKKKRESLIEKFGKNSIALVLPWHFRDGIVQNLGEYLGRSLYVVNVFSRFLIVRV
jgi:hypothetical protein